MSNIDTMTLAECQAALKQEQGKRIAVERESYETKKLAKQASEEAEAQKVETANALLEAASQMKVAICVSQGVYGLGQLCRNYLARKAASGRVVHREGQIMLLMQQMIDGIQKQDKILLETAQDKARAMIETIKRDGEANRMQAAQTALAYGLQNFEVEFDKLLAAKNPVV